MYDTFRHLSIREKRAGSISFRRGASSFSKKCRPEMHRVARTRRVFYHLSNSREAPRCHRNPFKLPGFAEMAFLGAWALLARCPNGKKRGLCVQQDASRGDIFSPRNPENPRRSRIVTPRHAAKLFVSPRKVSSKIVFFARAPHGASQNPAGYPVIERVQPKFLPGDAGL